MSSPGRRRSSQIVAENGRVAIGKRGKSVGKGKNGRPDLEGRRKHHTLQLYVGRRLLDLVQFQQSPQMLKVLSQEADKWDLAPKPTSLWWTSTYDSQEKTDLSIDSMTGRHRFLFEDEFKILGCSMNRQGKTHEGLAERMQSVNKAWWKDVKIYRSKDVPWRVKCRRIVDHVYSVFCFGSENWSWSLTTLDRIKGWETKGDEFSNPLQKKKKMKHGLTITRELAELPGNIG